MRAQKNNVIYCYYKLYEGNEDGQLLEETYPSTPIGFIYGIGMMIPGFEKNLHALVEGDKFGFLLTPSEAYGDLNFSAIKDVPIQNFMDEDGNLDRESIKEGAAIRMKNSNGFTFQGHVISSNLTIVKVDFNHPMAGKSLYFAGGIVHIREATKEELNAKRVLIPFG